MNSPCRGIAYEAARAPIWSPMELRSALRAVSQARQLRSPLPHRSVVRSRCSTIGDAIARGLTSRGGTTQTGLAELMTDARLSRLITAAVTAATSRSRHLSSIERLLLWAFCSERTDGYRPVCALPSLRFQLEARSLGTVAEHRSELDPVPRAPKMSTIFDGIYDGTSQFCQRIVLLDQLGMRAPRLP